MPQPRPFTMSADDYLAWEAEQAEKHELVDGQPVLRRLRMMAGGTGRHALIAMNVGAPTCAAAPVRPTARTGSSTAPPAPDVTVDCSPKTGRAVFAQAPRVVMEVLSAANDTMQVTRLIHDYLAIESLSAIVFFSQKAPLAQMFVREAAGWPAVDAQGLEAELALPGLDVSQPLAEVYEGVVFKVPAD